MSRAEIGIRGRSRRLNINYRTIATVGDHSVFTGPEPIVEKCSNEKAEAIVAWVQLLMNDRHLGTHEICVTPYKPRIRTALTSAGIATYELKPREEDPGSDEAGVRMGTMQRIKGLEFRAVAMACADRADPMNNLDEAGIRDRCERYVAATRAREGLLVTTAKEKD